MAHHTFSALQTNTNFTEAIDSSVASSDEG
jgi:hypothetical protein